MKSLSSKVPVIFLVMGFVAIFNCSKEPPPEKQPTSSTAGSTDLSVVYKAPAGMGDLKWGDSTGKFTELWDPPPWRLTNEDEDGNRIGARSLGSIGHVRLSGPSEYFFYKDRYYNFIARFQGKSYFMDLSVPLSEKYGKPKEKPLFLLINPNARVGTEYTWNLEDIVEITLAFNDLKDEGSLSYTYIPTLNELLKEGKKRANKLKDNL
jgi:hypothetical protein